MYLRARCNDSVDPLGCIVGGFVLPDPQHIPTQCGQSFVGIAITLLVGFDLFSPKFGVPFWPGSMLRASMPEASIDGNYSGSPDRVMLRTGVVGTGRGVEGTATNRSICRSRGCSYQFGSGRVSFISRCFRRPYRSWSYVNRPHKPLKSRRLRGCDFSIPRVRSGPRIMTSCHRCNAGVWTRCFVCVVRA